MARKYNKPICNFEVSIFQEYYTDKLQEQIDLLGNDSDIVKLWLLLKEKMGDFFQGIDIKPSLLHGDLWSGNYGQVDSNPVIYDAASFYGHHEYDLGIAGKLFLIRLKKMSVLQTQKLSMF